MLAKSELPTITMLDIKKLMENPGEEQSFINKISTNQYTLEQGQEKNPLQFLEEALSIEENLIKTDAVALIGASPSFLSKPQDEQQKLLHCIEDSLRRDNKLIKCLLSLTGFLYIFISEPHQDIQKGLKYIEEAIALGNGIAAYYLGYMYSNGNTMSPDLEKAKFYFKKAAKLDIVPAIVELGLIYQRELVVPQDYNKAKKLFEKAITLGSPDAKMYLEYLAALSGLAKFSKKNQPEQKREFDQEKEFEEKELEQVIEFLPKEESEQVNELLPKKEPEQEVVANAIEFALSLRKLYSSTNDATELLYLQEKFPSIHEIEYHVMMALNPQNINGLLNQYPRVIGECIVKDEELTNKEKYQLLIEKYLEPNQSASPIVAKFLKEAMKEIDKTAKNPSNPSVNFFKPATKAIKESKPEVLRQNILPGFTFEYRTDYSGFILFVIHSDKESLAEISITNQTKMALLECKCLADLEELSRKIEDVATIIAMVNQDEEEIKSVNNFV